MKIYRYININIDIYIYIYMKIPMKARSAMLGFTPPIRGPSYFG